MKEDRALPLIAAHRGGAGLWPENSLTAFRGAVTLGVDLLELDVHLTRDGEVVVIHDATLKRTTTGHGAISEWSWLELSKFPLSQDPSERIPHLREVLELVRRSKVGLLIEVKIREDGYRYQGLEDTVLNLLVAAGLLSRASIMAFEWDTLTQVRRLSPAARLTGLFGPDEMRRVGGVGAAVRQLLELGVNDLGIEQTLLTADTVAVARSAGVGIGVWTVSGRNELRRMLASGVDYVTTDRPDLALALRAEMT